MINRRVVSWMLSFGTFAVAAILIVTQVVDATPSVTIDRTSRHQVMRGWEVSTRMWEFDKGKEIYDGSWRPVVGRVLDKLIADGGINRVRLELSSGLENPVDYWSKFSSGEIGYQEIKAHFYDSINDNESAEVINPDGFNTSAFDERVKSIVLPMKERLEAKGETIFLTVTFVDFRWTEIKGNISHANSPSEYAEFITFYFKRLQDKYGLVPDALEIILEPDNSDYWRGPQIAEAAQYVSEHLGKLGFHPILIAPSTASAKKAYRYYEDIHDAFDGPGPISVLSFHKYNGSERWPLRRIAAAAKEDGIETAMLELTWGNIDGLFDDILIARVSAWQKYGIARKVENGVSPSSNSYMIDAEFDGGEVTLRLSEPARLLAPVFRAIRSGAIVLGAETSGRWLRAIAAENTSGGIAVAVRTSKAGEFSLSGLESGSYLVSYYSGNSDEIDSIEKVTVGGAEAVTIRAPGSGVLIIQP